MARTPKATDAAAQARKADVDEQKRDQGPLDVGNQEERTPSATELIKDHPEIFGEETGKATDRKTPQDRQVSGNIGLTADQKAAAIDGEPVNKAAKTEGQQIELGDRVMLTTATPIGGQTTNPAHVIGFNPINGQPNLRLENLDGARGRPLEFGGVPQNAPQEERGPFWQWPSEFEKKDDKADNEA